MWSKFENSLRRYVLYSRSKDGEGGYHVLDIFDRARKITQIFYGNQ